jgi:predicted AAA+ superfamily ATPase
MQVIKREMQDRLAGSLKPNKVSLLLGSRRVGKTFLIRELIKSYSGKVLLMNAEDLTTQKLLSERSIENYRNILAGVDLLIIDEAQVIPEIGKILKLIVDEVHGIKIIASGSSSFDLLNLSGEPLTGRSTSFKLFPLAQSEFSIIENPVETKQHLEGRLIFGGYPELIHLPTQEEKINYLTDLVHHYLLQDILALEGLRASSKMMNLIRLLAFQVGNEVSYHELGKQLNLSKNTVEKYLDLLCKVFVIFRLGAYSKNLRKEIVKTSKWYFTDNGIRNAVLSDFKPFNLRTDRGELWENYIIGERIKRSSYRGSFVNYYFWRTYDQQEIDLVEENNQQITAYEIKWTDKPVKPPIAFRNAYPEAEFYVITPTNYLPLIM